MYEVLMATGFAAIFAYLYVMEKPALFTLKNIWLVASIGMMLMALALNINVASYTCVQSSNTINTCTYTYSQTVTNMSLPELILVVILSLYLLITIFKLAYDQMRTATNVVRGRT